MLYVARRLTGYLAAVAASSCDLAHSGVPALVIYENGRVPGLLSREGVAAVVAVTTTRNLLTMAQESGIIVDAEAVWQRIIAAVPTANPASVLTFINPAES